MIPAIEQLAKQLDVPISIDTWRSEVAEAAFSAGGAVLGNDISGFADPRYLAVAAAATPRSSRPTSASRRVCPTHSLTTPMTTSSPPSRSSSRERLRRALAVGLSPQQVVLDAGLDLGKSPTQSLALLRASGRLAAIGPALLLSASNKTFLGALLDLDISDRREASIAAAALGVARGCRVLRVHDVAGTRRVVDALHAVLSS